MNYPNVKYFISDKSRGIHPAKLWKDSNSRGLNCYGFPNDQIRAETKKEFLFSFHPSREKSIIDATARREDNSLTDVTSRIYFTLHSTAERQSFLIWQPPRMVARTFPPWITLITITRLIITGSRSVVNLLSSRTVDWLASRFALEFIAN